MNALTVHQPWDFALLHGKAVENRKQKPPRNLVGKRIALHAGLTYDYDGATFIKRTLAISTLPHRRSGVIFATTVLVGHVERDTEACRREALESLASSPEISWALESEWFFGPYGYVLQDTRALAKPVVVRGMQGFWPIGADVLARVLEQLEAAC